MSGTRTDGRVERGNQTRRLVLGRTMDIASVEGLEGLSLGRIATELKLSKSGVFALFGSKEELQLATVRAAAAVFAERVVKPLADVPPGARRVRELCRAWLAYSSERV
ncbi:TetR/AcrR family transcriptional regulator, partial [Streptomyces sp.]